MSYKKVNFNSVINKPPTKENIVAQFLSGARSLADSTTSGIGKALGQTGEFIEQQAQTPEGRRLLTNIVGALTQVGGASPYIGAGIAEQSQKAYEQDIQAQKAYEQDMQGQKEQLKLDLKRQADIDAALEKEERQSRRDFAKAGYIPKLTDDPFLPPELSIEFTSPVSGKPIQLVKQTEATKRQVDVFQNGEKTKMYANSVEDAKKIKDINEASEKIERLTTSLIRNRRKYTGGLLDPKLKTKMQQDITDLRLAYKDMAGLGVISESDVEYFIKKALPDPTRITLRKNIIESELTNFKQRALEDRDAAYEGRVYNYERSVIPITDDQQKDPKDYRYNAQRNLLIPENLKKLSAKSSPELNIVDGYIVEVER